MGFGDFLKGAGKKLDDAAEAVGEVASDVGKTAASVPVGAVSATMDAITGAGNMRHGPLGPQGPNAGPQGTGIAGAAGTATRRNLQETARTEGRTPQQAYRAAFEDPRVKAAINTTGRVVGEGVSRAVDPGGHIQRRVFGRDVIANSGEVLARSLANQAAAPGYLLDPEVIGGVVDKAGFVAEQAAKHPELIAPTAKMLGKQAIKSATKPENLIAFAAETALTGGVGAISAKTRSHLFTEAATEGLEGIAAKQAAKQGVEEVAESAVEKAVRPGGIGAYGMERIETSLKPQNLRAPALTTEQMAVPKPGGRTGPSLLQRVGNVGTSRDWNPASSWFADKRTQAAGAFLESRQNPTSRLNQFTASTIQGHTGAMPAAVPGMTAETLAAQRGKWGLSAGLASKGKILAASEYIQATAHPGEYAVEKGKEFATEHQDQIREIAQDQLQKHGDDIANRARQEATDRGIDVPEMPKNLDDLKGQAQAKVDDLKGQAEDKLDEETQRTRPNTNTYDTYSGGQAVPKGPSSTVSANGVPTPEGMQETVASDTARSTPLGRRGAASPP